MYVNWLVFTLYVRDCSSSEIRLWWLLLLGNRPLSSTPLWNFWLALLWFTRGWDWLIERISPIPLQVILWQMSTRVTFSTEIYKARKFWICLYLVIKRQLLMNLLTRSWFLQANLSCCICSWSNYSIRHRSWAIHAWQWQAILSS